MPARPRCSLPAYPRGWYCVGFSDELAAGSLLTRRFMGREIVLFRTASGHTAAVEAHCPHLGGHFGHGGTVEGEVLRCPFHHFCFDVEGRCVATGYRPGGTIRADLESLCLRERHGLLLVYHDPSGRAPTWEIPDLETDGWSRLQHGCWKLRTHPQEVTENSVDIGHFGAVHGFTAVEVLEPLRNDGPHLSARYGISRRAGGLGRPREVLRAEFEFHVHGLGYSFVDLEIRSQGLRIRLWVLPTPIDEGRLELRGAVRAHGSVGSGLPRWALGWMPSAWRRELLCRLAFREYARDLKRDFAIWENKTYIERPMLAKGDGPIGLYRKWAGQFYRDDSRSLATGPRSVASGAFAEGAAASP